PTEILVANDLDTLPANYFISKFRKVKLYYDSHEIFTEVPELVSRPRVQRIWKRIEKWILPGIQKMYTVNESIAGIYSREYTKVVGVVRNVPFRRVPQTTYADRKSLGLPEDKTIFIFQGAGINVHRGAEEVLAAMQYTEGILLLFVGSGDVIDFLKAEQKRLGLEDKVLFVSRQPMEKLRVYTSNSDFGLSLDKDSNLNYRYSLPNKLFDYIQAEIPVLASDLPEIRKIVDGYSIGEILRSHEPRAIADQMMQLAGNSEMRAVWKANLKKASEELCWENEVNRLYEIYKDVI
ncbi:MAG TPA: glycosyltransferase, partial [Bacteroidia bacterium]|nr:glycosyltransferase [Bacteroidia bacterium]